MLGSEIRFPLQQEGRIRKVLPSFFCRPVHEGLGTCDLKTPLPGVGGVCQNSRTTRAARGSESRFPLQNRREESKRFFPLSFVCRCMRDPAHATSKRPFQGPGVSASIREPLARSASASPVFRSKAKGRIFRDSPFCFCMPVHEGLGTCDLKAPLPGVGGVC